MDIITDLILDWIIIIGISYAIYRQYEKKASMNKLLCSKRTYALIETAVAVVFVVLSAIAGRYWSVAYGTGHGFNATASMYSAFFRGLALDLVLINSSFTYFYSRSLGWSTFKSAMMGLLTLLGFSAPIPFLMIMFSKPKSPEIIVDKKLYEYSREIEKTK